MKILVWVHDLIASPKFFRRVLLTSAIVYIGVVLWKVMIPEILLHIETPGASIVLGVIGILGTICGLYLKLRTQDDHDASVTTRTNQSPTGSAARLDSDGGVADPPAGKSGKNTGTGETEGG